MNLNNPDDVMREVFNNRKIRSATAKADLLMFTNLYLSHHIGYEMAPMHQQMFSLAQDSSLRFGVVMAFRGSGKSTILAMAYPIWAVIGVQQKKFVMIVSQTQPQAKQLFTNIRKELESNIRLQCELGPFESFEDEWGNSGIVLSKYGARIMAASVDQSIRGVKHGAYRPDLIILDDVEDVQAVRTDESREKTYKWFTGEVMPLGDLTTKFVLIGNKLHEESLVMRVADSIRTSERRGMVLEYPVYDETERSLWPGKYPDAASLLELEQEIGDNVAFRREYLLEIIDSAEPVVYKQWLQYYPELPGEAFRFQHMFSATGVDLASSLKDRADFTAMVSAHVYRIDDQLRIYILPNPFNEKIDFPAQVAQAKAISTNVGVGSRSRLFIEDVGYQAVLIQALESEGYPASGYKPQGQDKRSRLSLASLQIQNGTVLFPAEGCEDLLHQLLGFPGTKHDDLVDAFTTLILKVMESADDDVPGFRIVKTNFWRSRTLPEMSGSTRGYRRHSIANMSDDEFFNR